MRLKLLSAPGLGKSSVPSPATAYEATNILDARWRIFLRVANVGSLSKAANALDMPQSMVSRAITHLERQCGERLFQRTGRGVLLTEFGIQLLPGISRLASDADALADDIRSAKGQPVGEVLLGLLPSAVRRFTGPLCSALREQMPGVRLHLVEGASAQLEEQLREGRLDMAMVPREDAAAINGCRLIARVPLHLLGRLGDAVVTPDEISMSALSGLPLVVPARPHPLRARLDRLAAEQNLQLRVVVEADSVNLQYEVAAAGGGYAIAAVAGPQDPRLASARIVEPELERFVVLAESPRRPHTRATREVRRLICEIAATMNTY